MAIEAVEAQVQQELATQFDTAVAFADFCAFLTSGRVSGQAQHLIDLAQQLYAETTEDLHRSRPRP